MPHDHLPTPKRRGKSPEEIRRIAEIVYASATYREAAEAAGMDYRTFLKWKEGQPFKRALEEVKAEALEKAKADAKRGEGSILEKEMLCQELLADQLLEAIKAGSIKPDAMAFVMGQLLKNTQTRQGLPTEVHKHTMELADRFSKMDVDELNRWVGEHISLLREARQAVENPYARRGPEPVIDADPTQQ